MKTRISIVLTILISALMFTAGAALAGGIFNDVPNNHTHAASIQWASENGIVQGYSDGSFRPDENVTRGQLATMLRRYDAYLEFKGQERSARGYLPEDSDEHQREVDELHGN